MKTEIILRASSSQKYALCPASYWRELHLPESTSEYAESGTRCHAALAGALRDGKQIPHMADPDHFMAAGSDGSLNLSYGLFPIKFRKSIVGETRLFLVIRFQIICKTYASSHHKNKKRTPPPLKGP